MIDVTDLSKSYGPVQALRGVSFHVDAGEIIGLLGPNGAGKTTMMKILTGYLQPTEGTVTVDDLDVLTQAEQIQQRLGYLPENAPLYPELSVQAYLRMIAELRQIPEDRQPALLSEAVRATGLAPYLTRPIGQLSKGYRQRVGLAQAIVHKPKLLILDEPTIGLDPTQIVEVRRLIGRLAEHSTILLSTHILSEVEAVCNRVIILINGEIRADAQLAQLEASTDVILILAERVPGVADRLRKLEGVRSVETEPSSYGTAYRVKAIEGTDGDSETSPSLDLRPMIYELVREMEWPLIELRRDVRTLEAVFNELATTGGDEQ